MARYFVWQIEIGNLKRELLLENKYFKIVKEEVDRQLIADGYTINKDGSIIKNNI